MKFFSTQLARSLTNHFNTGANYGINHKYASTAASLSSAECRQKRNFLFSQEQKRQHENIGRIEKIEVKITGRQEELCLSMNKHISTPYNCAQHISQSVVERSALALVNGSTLWDMHRPITDNCTLQFLQFKDSDPHFVNKAFWRACSIVLGAVITNSFKDGVKVNLHSFPPPNVKSGSFVYDVQLGVHDWKPREDELRILSSEMVKFAMQNHKFERLVVNKELALEIFEGNPHKQEQIPQIAAQNEGHEVILYRVGGHIDISRGPMVGDTSFIGRCTLASVHQISTEYGELYRFQGVSLPKGIMLNHFGYSVLEDRARKLNPGRFPGASPTFSEDFEAVGG